MKDLKTVIVILSMLLLFLVIGVMLWNKSSAFRINELKQITDYIVESNFKYQNEHKESDFIKRASILEGKLLKDETITLNNIDLNELKAIALSFAPYGTELSLQQKMTLIGCLEKINIKLKNNKQCTVDYAKQNVGKGL